MNSECKESLTRNLEDKYDLESIKIVTAETLKLFAYFKSEYGDLFEYKKHCFEPIRAREWAVEILEAGISADEFYYGRYQAVKKCKYPLERAYEFIELCKQFSNNVYPDVRQSYIDAANLNYRHEVSYETAKRVGFWDIKTLEQKVTYKKWQKYYPIVCREHSQGAVFHKPLSHQVKYEHKVVEVGSEEYNQIDEKLARLRRVMR